MKPVSPCETVIGLSSAGVRGFRQTFRTEVRTLDPGNGSARGPINLVPGRARDDREAGGDEGKPVLVATPHRPAGHRAFRAQLSRPSSGKSLHRSDFLSLRSPKRGEGYYWGTASPQSSPRPAGERDRVRGRHESDRQSMPTHPARPGLSCHFSSLSRCRTGKVQPTFPGNAPRVCDPARRRPRAVVRE